MSGKKILFVCRRSPYGTSLAREALEAILAGGVFEQNISVLFMDDGVFQLLPEQKPDSIESKNHLAMLQALPLYDVESLYVEDDSLRARGLDHQSLAPPLRQQIEALDNAAVKQLFAVQDTVVSF